tara:strand:+ start:208 stop:456 length:249 start_codon:yes stop_codon:yes gene_type:complete
LANLPAAFEKTGPLGAKAGYIGFRNVWQNGRKFVAKSYGSPAGTIWAVAWNPVMTGPENPARGQPWLQNFELPSRPNPGMIL